MAKVINIFTRPEFSTNQRLSGLVVTSVVIHLLLLSYWFQSSSPLPITSAPLSVTLLQSQDEQIGTTKQTANIATETETARPADSSVETSPVAVQVQTVAPLVAKVITAPAPKPQTDNSSAATTVKASVAIELPPAPTQTLAQLKQSVDEQEPLQRQADVEHKSKPGLSLTQVRAQLHSQLVEDLAHHFHYPRLARKRAWQGEALLNLKIEPDGRISRILLTKSSGYSLLDDTAIKTVKKIANVKKLDQWLNGRAIEMELPVIYRLTNS